MQLDDQGNVMIVEDTGLDIPRSDKVVVVQVVSRPRGKEAKQTFYKLLVDELRKSCGIEPSDVMVSIIENSDEDWSFGNGIAQYVKDAAAE